MRLQFPAFIFVSISVVSTAFCIGQHHPTTALPHRSTNSDKGGEEDRDDLDPKQSKRSQKNSGVAISIIEESDVESRIVATSDGKIPPTATLLSSSSSFHDSIDSIYNALNNKSLKKLNQLNGKSLNANTTQIIKESLESSGFRLLSQRDVDLCKALNEGYLLRLSIVPDIGGLDVLYSDFFGTSGEDDDTHSSRNIEKLPFGGRVLVFRRGYGQEITTGKLLLPKLDYLQSSLVQRSASELTARLTRLERSITSTITRSYQKQFQPLFETKLDSLKEQILDEVPLEADMNVLRVEETLEKGVNKLKNVLKDTGASLNKTKINIKLGRYKRFGDDADPLNSFLVYNMELQKDDRDAGNELMERRSVEQYLLEGISSGSLSCKYDAERKSSPASNQRTNVTSTTSVPTDRLLERVSIANLVDFFSTGGRRRLFKTLFSVSELQEPTYDEVVLVWRPKKSTTPKAWKPPRVLYNILKTFDLDHKLTQLEEPPLDSELPLEIRTFCSVPMANVLALLPKTKIVFNPADALIFDLVNVFTFLAVAASYKFDSARLDLVALGVTVLWVVRSFLRYSNKYARYDLVINKFLTSRLTYRNKGALKYLANEAGVQRARRASLVYEWLVDDGVVSSSRKDPRTKDDIVHSGLSELDSRLDAFHFPLHLDVGAALDDLKELGLLHFDNKGRLTGVKSGGEALEALAIFWNDLL